MAGTLREIQTMHAKMTTFHFHSMRFRDLGKDHPYMEPLDGSPNRRPTREPKNQVRTRPIHSGHGPAHTGALEHHSPHHSVASCRISQRPTNPASGQPSRIPPIPARKPPFHLVDEPLYSSHAAPPASARPGHRSWSTSAQAPRRAGSPPGGGRNYTSGLCCAPLHHRRRHRPCRKSYRTNMGSNGRIV